MGTVYRRVAQAAGLLRRRKRRRASWMGRMTTRIAARFQGFKGYPVRRQASAPISFCETEALVLHSLLGGLPQRPVAFVRVEEEAVRGAGTGF